MESKYRKTEKLYPEINKFLEKVRKDVMRYFPSETLLKKNLKELKQRSKTKFQEIKNDAEKYFTEADKYLSPNLEPQVYNRLIKVKEWLGIIGSS